MEAPGDERDRLSNDKLIGENLLETVSHSNPPLPLKVAPQRYDNIEIVRQLLVITTQLEELLAFINTLQIPAWLLKKPKK